MFQIIGQKIKIFYKNSFNSCSFYPLAYAAIPFVGIAQMPEIASSIYVSSRVSMLFSRFTYSVSASVMSRRHCAFWICRSDMSEKC